MDRFQAETLAALPRRLIEMPRRWAAETPDAPAVWFQDRLWRHGDILAGIEAAHTVLLDAGVRAGDRVALVIENGVAGLCYFHAIAALDCWAVLANARLLPRELEVIFEESGARFAVFGTGESEAAAKHAAGRGVTEKSSPHFADTALLLLDDNAPAEPVFDDSAEQIAAMIFTSGSTGRPKGAMLSHRAFLYQSAIVAYRRSFAPGDCPYVVAPMVHVLGLAGMVLPCLHVGAAIRLSARFDVAEVAQALGVGDLTHLYGPPPMFAALISHAATTGGRIKAPKLKEILVGGAPANEELRAAASTVLGMKIGAGYAATEFTPISASVPSDPVNAGAVGRPFPGVELKIVDEKGAGLAQGEIGEVWCRGPGAMNGYYRDQAATDAVMKEDGWLAIGDLAFLDEDGQIHLVGRLKDIILRSGFTVYPAEIEAVLSAHPDVLQSSVVGRAVPDNEEVIAYIQPAPGAVLDIAEILAFARERLAPYKRPGRIIPLEALPVGPTGKVAKEELRRAAAELD